MFFAGQWHAIFDANGIKDGMPLASGHQSNNKGLIGEVWAWSSYAL